jgi:hypothetical protein
MVLRDPPQGAARPRNGGPRRIASQPSRPSTSGTIEPLIRMPHRWLAPAFGMAALERLAQDRAPALETFSLAHPFFYTPADLAALRWRASALG